MRVILAGDRRFGHLFPKQKLTDFERSALSEAREYFRDLCLARVKRWEMEHGKITQLVSGVANGIDDICIDIAKQVTGKKAKEFPAKWSTFQDGKAAGTIRNQKMAEYADGAIIIAAFDSKGSFHMNRCMKDKKLPVDLTIMTKVDFELLLPDVIPIYWPE